MREPGLPRGARAAELRVLGKTGGGEFSGCRRTGAGEPGCVCGGPEPRRMVGAGVPAAAAPRNGAVGGGVADYNSQRALRRRAAPAPLTPGRTGHPRPPGEPGGIAPPVSEQRSEGFVSATEFVAVRSEQQRPPAVGGCHGAGGHTSAWPGLRDRRRPLQGPGCHSEHGAVLQQRRPCETSPERVLTGKGVAALRCFIAVELACGKDNEI